MWQGRCCFFLGVAFYNSHSLTVLYQLQISKRYHSNWYLLSKARTHDIVHACAQEWDRPRTDEADADVWKIPRQGSHHPRLGRRRLRFPPTFILSRFPIMCWPGILNDGKWRHGTGTTKWSTVMNSWLVSAICKKSPIYPFLVSCRRSQQYEDLSLFFHV